MKVIGLLLMSIGYISAGFTPPALWKNKKNDIKQLRIGKVEIICELN